MNYNRIKRSELETTEAKLVDVEKTVMSYRIDRLITDLLYISSSFELDGAAGRDYSSIKARWLAFSNSKKIYDQIRFIDASGNEVLRVNYSSDGAYATASEDLQNKSERPYFQSTITLQKHQIYISKLDLNFEYGAIETPIKPMIRLATPVFHEDGTLDGIIILNYLAEDMLSQVRTIASTSTGDIFLLNQRGPHQRMELYV
jgi:hypothetical protein